MAVMDRECLIIVETVDQSFNFIDHINETVHEDFKVITIDELEIPCKTQLKITGIFIDDTTILTCCYAIPIIHKKIYCINGNGDTIDMMIYKRIPDIGIILLKTVKHESLSLKSFLINHISCADHVTYMEQNDDSVITINSETIVIKSVEIETIGSMLIPDIPVLKFYCTSKDLIPNGSILRNDTGYIGITYTLRENYYIGLIFDIILRLIENPLKAIILGNKCDEYDECECEYNGDKLNIIMTTRDSNYSYKVNGKKNRFKFKKGDCIIKVDGKYFNEACCIQNGNSCCYVPFETYSLLNDKICILMVRNGKEKEVELMTSEISDIFDVSLNDDNKITIWNGNIFRHITEEFIIELCKTKKINEAMGYALIETKTIALLDNKCNKFIRRIGRMNVSESFNFGVLSRGKKYDCILIDDVHITI